MSGDGFFPPRLEEQEFFQLAFSVCKQVPQAGITLGVHALAPRCDVDTGPVGSLRPDKAVQADRVIPWLPNLTYESS